jgi:group I intron endonuclease
MIIYRALNKINNKVYIGKTIKTLKSRINSHLCYAFTMNYDTLFYRALRKYGKDVFEWSVLYECDDESELNEKEKEYIILYNARNRSKGYNISGGGHGGDNISKNPNRNIIIEKISKAKLGKKMSESFKIQNRLRQIGVKRSSKTCEKISNALTGRIISTEHRKNLSLSLKGRKIPQDIIDKISQKLKGRVFSEEHKEAIGLSRKGGKLSKATKEKIKQSWIRRKILWGKKGSK